MSTPPVSANCRHSVEPAELVRAARAYLGVPFRHAGRSRYGVDCVGLLLCAAHDLGLTDWDDVHYSRIVDPERLRRDIERFCDPVEELQPGDVLLFALRGSAQHVGLLTTVGSEPQMIHALAGEGRVVEHGLSGPWRRRLVRGYRWRF